MTRIISGSAGGRTLQTPTGDGTRPTSDRVREALFSALESGLGSLSGLRFLDLYAGSGAVGLEAVSRGATHATLVEHDRRAAAVIAGNIKSLAMTSADLVAGPVARFLAGTPRASYEVVFLDPPYVAESGEVEAVLAALARPGWLSPDAVVVIERSKRTSNVTWPEGFEAGRARKYGETTLLFGTWLGLG